MQFFVKNTSRPVAHFSLDERRKDGWLVVCGKLVRSSKNNGLVCKFLYYLASSISGQDESNPALLERARWSYLVIPGLPAVCHKKKFSKSHIKKSFIDQACRSRWFDIDFVYGLRLGPWTRKLKKNLINIQPSWAQTQSKTQIYILLTSHSNSVLPNFVYSLDHVLWKVKRPFPIFWS